MLALTILAGGILVWQIVSDLLNRKERDKMLNRLMARTYQEYEYFRQEYPGTVKDVEKIRANDIEKEIAKESFKSAASDEMDRDLEQKKKEFLDGMDEDWDENLIDQEKLSELVK